MSFIDWLEYALVNFFAATAIAIDACVLILVKFRDLSSNSVAIRWAGAVGLTHILFPMVGFIGGWILAERYHLAPFVYALGASLLALLIFVVIREAVAIHPQPGDPSPGSMSFPKALTFWIAVLSVSLDALLSGPGKTVLLERYPKSLAWLSFIIVGLLVALFTLVAGAVSRFLHKRFVEGRVMSPNKLARGMTAAIVGEVVLFSFFLTWSLAKSIEHLAGQNRLDVPLLYIGLLGIGLGGSISAFFYNKTKAAQLSRAEQVVARSRSSSVSGRS